jgi:hypothetical protein
VYEVALIGKQKTSININSNAGNENNRKRYC